jgi:plastocyanin
LVGTTVASGLVLSMTASAADHVVNALSNMTFSPKTLTINAGDTVTFKNGGGFHNVASDPGAVTAFRCANGCDGTGGNGDLSSTSWSATVAFPTAGTAAFHCEAHGAAGGIGMSGTITVQSAPVQKRRYDFNGDGRSDVLWRNGSTGANSIWLSANSATKQAVASLLDPAWTVAGSGDYNGDGRADILWRNVTTGADSIWLSANSATKQAVATVADQSWKVAGSGDYTGDGRADVLWRNGTTGANSLWPSANQAMKQVLTAQPVAWSVVGTVE